MTSIERDRRDRWERFYRTDDAREVDPARRSDSARGPHDDAPHHLLFVETPALDPPRPPLRPERKDERIEWAWAKYQAQLERMAWLNDDRVPYLDCLTGTEIFAAAFGCDVDYPEADNPFAIPLVHDPDQASALTIPGLDAPSLALSFEIADELRRRAGNDALLRLPDIQSPLDIAGIVWDKNDFFVSVIEAPDAVRELAAKTGALLTSFLDEWFARYGRSFVAHYPDYYMPNGISLSEDEIGSVGPEVFRTLFLPELNALSARYGAIGIHCCAHAVHQWDGIAKVHGLRVLNLNQPADVIAQALPRFADVAAQMPVSAPVEPPADRSNAGAWVESWGAAFAAAGSARVVYTVTATSDDEATAIAEGFRSATASEEPLSRALP